MSTKDRPVELLLKPGVLITEIHWTERQGKMVMVPVESHITKTDETFVYLAPDKHPDNETKMTWGQAQARYDGSYITIRGVQKSQPPASCKLAEHPPTGIESVDKIIGSLKEKMQ